jgi:hypothetical protein
MTAVSRDHDFDRTVDDWVSRAFARGAGSFADLVRALPGVTPMEAMRSVRRLGYATPAGRTAVAPLRSRHPGDDWPVEHPLDFDWRFTPEAARLLIGRCPGPLDGPIALLGTPTLALEATRQGRKGRVSLFDINPTLIESARASRTNLASFSTDLVWGAPVDMGDAFATFADPPWYPEYVVAFLWAASRLTRVGGRVFLSFPPVGTRPGIVEERASSFAQAARFGLRLESVELGALAYGMPLFEYNAFLVAEVPEVADDWRRGDLIEFVHEERKFAPRPVAPDPPDAWDDVAVGVVRIKCKSSRDKRFRDPTLRSIVPGDMLATVSRRDPARASADVWTCGNRVFRCAGPDVFRTILSAIANGEDVEEAVESAVGRDLSSGESQMVRRAAEQASDLVQREESEVVEYVHRRRESDLAKIFR